jgi:hypothetical protein
LDSGKEYAMETVDIEAVLESAATLVSNRRRLQAIDELMAAYREHPDDRLARELVFVRSAAFREVSKKPGRPDWPATFADPAPGHPGVFEIDGSELSGEMLGGAITHHGCLRVNALLDEPTVDRLVEGIDQAFVARERIRNGAPPESAAPWFIPYGPGQGKAEKFGGSLFVRVIDTPRTMCDLTEIFAAVGIRQAVTDYLGERPAMIANKWIMRRSPSGVVLGDFHQDGAFLGEGIRTVDCWISLSHCGPGTGRPAMDIVPARLERIIPPGDGAAFDWSLTEDAVKAAVPDAPIVSPVFAPGDALFFDERLPHRTSVGPDLGVRYAIESWFVAPSSYPKKHLPVVL